MNDYKKIYIEQDMLLLHFMTSCRSIGLSRIKNIEEKIRDMDIINMVGLVQDDIEKVGIKLNEIKTILNNPVSTESELYNAKLFLKKTKLIKVYQNV